MLTQKEKIIMALIDRVRISIPETEIQELRPRAIVNIDTTYKNPTNKPVIAYKFASVVFDMNIPRALFDNTIEEAKIEDWDKIVNYIQKYGCLNGLNIEEKSIANARIWYLEIGKNILIPNRYCIYNLLKKIAKCLVKRMEKIQTKQFVNEIGSQGSKTAILINKRDIGFYDKTAKELSNTATYNKSNRILLKWLLEEGWKVLRYEVKLCCSDMIKQALRSCKIGFTFSDVWHNQADKKLLKYFFEPIEQTVPPAKSKKEILMKQIRTARIENISMRDICIKVGLDTLEREFGATTLKNAFIGWEDKIKGKKAEMAYIALRNKRKAINKHFKEKKEYVINRIKKVITELEPIRINKETGDIEGVL